MEGRSGPLGDLMTSGETQRKIKIFADGADRNSMLAAAADPLISGLTTNPTLMRKAGVSEYVPFAKDILSSIRDKPISFEVFADDIAEMERQAQEIAAWGDNVYVKIPITNTEGVPTFDLCGVLSEAGVKLNVTAIFTLAQIEGLLAKLSAKTPSVISVFAGRIADSGVDPIPTMLRTKEALAGFPRAELLWASPREILNLVQAEDAGCDIITMTPDLISKLKSLGKDLDEFSLDTVKMFYSDAAAAGYSL